MYFVRIGNWSGLPWSSRASALRFAILATVEGESFDLVGVSDAQTESFKKCDGHALKLEPFMVR